MNPLPIVWLSGTFVMLGAGIIGYRRNLRRIISTAMAPDESLLHALHIAAQEAGLRGMPRVLVSPLVKSPAVTGIFRSTLLLPAGFLQDFNESEARLILLHEFSHLKRHDLPVNGLSCVLQALHWFNPLMWFAFARMRADREAACDARVLSINSDDRRADYGNALLKLQTAHPSHGLSLGFVGIFERSCGMKSRIREISGHRRAGFAGRAGGAALVTLLIAFGATRAQEPPMPQLQAKKATAAETDATSARVDAINRKLDAVIIPNLQMPNGYLHELIRFIWVAGRMDEVKVREAGDIPFAVMLPRGENWSLGKKISIDRQNITMRELIIDASEQSGMAYQVDEWGVKFFPPGSAEDLIKAVTVPAPEGAAAHYAERLKIPSFSFRSVTLAEAVDYLNRQCLKLTEKGPVYPIVIDPRLDPKTPIEDIRLKDQDLSIVLQYCAESINQTWTANDKEIRIQPK